VFRRTSSAMSTCQRSKYSPKVSFDGSMYVPSSRSCWTCATAVSASALVPNPPRMTCWRLSPATARSTPKVQLVRSLPQRPHPRPSTAARHLVHRRKIRPRLTVLVHSSRSRSAAVRGVVWVHRLRALATLGMVAAKHSVEHCAGHKLPTTEPKRWDHAFLGQFVRGAPRDAKDCSSLRNSDRLTRQAHAQ